MNSTNQSTVLNETLLFNNTTNIVNKTGVLLLWSIGSITCLMNIIVIFALIKANILRENTHKVLVLSLSFSDFLSGIGAILYGFDLLLFRFAGWSFFLILYSMFVSLSQIFLLCIEAYLSVCASMVYKEKLLGGNRKYIVISVIWLINLLYFSILYFSISGVNAGFVSSVVCVSFSLVYVLTVLFYVKTLHKIRLSKRKINVKRDDVEKLQSRSKLKVYCRSADKSDTVDDGIKVETAELNRDQVKSIRIRERSSAFIQSEPRFKQRNARQNNLFLGDQAVCSTDSVTSTKQKSYQIYCTSHQTNQQTIKAGTSNREKSSEDRSISIISIEKSFNSEKKAINTNTNKIEYDKPEGSQGSSSTSHTEKNERGSQKVGAVVKRRNVGFKNMTWHCRSSITIGLILLVVTLCSVPFIVLTFLFSLNVPYIGRRPVHYSGMFMLLNGIMNPIIYVLRIREFRNLQWLRF